ncbi:hypothetical protein ACRAWC_20880 [Leifsonia sp. L25]|uniref:hypothetical protein n=1 Tax=Leifsonia sp. L25 TaxID=3423957 RepID=UPI003D69885E
MIGLAIIFGPIAMPIIVLVVVVVWIVAARHLWRPVLLAAGMLTGVLLAGVLAPIVQASTAADRPDAVRAGPLVLVPPATCWEPPTSC